MKPCFFRLPVLALTAGLSLALMGCHTDAAEKSAAARTAQPGVASAAPVTTPAPGPTGLPGTNAPALASAEAGVPVLSTNAPVARIAPQPTDVSAGVREVVDMAQAQVGDAVLLEFVKSRQQAFDLDADDIVYLKDVGVPEEVVTMMLKRDGELREQALAATPAAEAPAPEGATPEESVPPTATAPAEGTESVAAPTTVYASTVTPDASSAPPVEAAAGSPPPVTSNYFYSALSPYGSWLYIQPYGWCWQPTCAVTVTDWRPYSHGGRWLYTTGGWYWQSHYSWGWAPFHYGNWYINPACGWVWVPGSTWGPAWVTWRYTDAFCGWAPLPPGCGWSRGFGLTYWGSGVSVGFSFGLSSSCYTFVGWDHCWRPYPYRYRLGHGHHTTVYNQSTVINNYYVDNSKNLVVNHGVPTKHIPAATRRDMRRLDIKDIQAGHPAPVRPEQTSLDGRKVAAYRPVVPPDLKASPTRSTDVPYRVSRTRTDEPKPSRSGLSPGRASVDSSSGTSGFSAPPRSRTSPATDASPRGSVDTAPSRSGPQSPTTASTPTRRESPAATRSVPTSANPTSASSPPRTSPNRSTVGSTPGAPARAGNLSRPAPQTPARSGGAAPSTQVPGIQTRSSPTARPYELDGRSRPTGTRSEAPKPATTLPPSRYFSTPPTSNPGYAPSRSPAALPSAPSRQSTVPASPAGRSTPPAYAPNRAVVPSAPPASINRSAPATPNFRNPPAAAAPPARSASQPSVPSAASGNPAPAPRSSPSGAPPSRGVQPQ